MRILTVISNYNEEREIKNCLDNFKSHSSISSDLLVIDNSSTDCSLEIIKNENVNFLAHPVNTGGSRGVIKTAFLYSYLNSYDIYCHIDGDNQHNARDLLKLVDPIINDEADIVMGSRFLDKKGFQSLFFRRIGIRVFSKLVSKLTGQEITDITSGFRAYNKRAIEFFAKKYKHEIEPCVQMFMVASYAGLTLKEVPVYMKPRLTGKSEFNFLNSLKFPFYGIISIIGTMLQKNTIKDT
jgi:GT2 family glycosyltransferase